MNADELSRFDELVSRYLDAELAETDAAELVALLALPSLASRFLDMTRLNSEIAGLVASPVPNEAMVQLVQADLDENRFDSEQFVSGVRLRMAERTGMDASPQTAVFESRPKVRQVKTQPWTVAWAAVFLALAALSGIYFSGILRSPIKMNVAAVQGEVYLIDDSGQTRLMGPRAFGKTGKLKTVGSGSSVTLVLSDGTRVDVGGDSLLGAKSVRGNARFFLEDGSLKSQITAQPKNRLLTFATPESEAIVKGTALSLVTWAHHTRLVVTEGVVLMKRQEDGAEVLVRAGFHVLVAPNTKLVASPNESGAHHR